jgi:hypothetical protein
MPLFHGYSLNKPKYSGSHLSLSPTLQNLRRVSTRGHTISHIPLSSIQPVRAELVEARIFSFPTLQNLRIENRLLRRENLSGLWVELKDFSLNKILGN